jgi:hypothetical protein
MMATKKKAATAETQPKEPPQPEPDEQEPDEEPEETEEEPKTQPSPEREEVPSERVTINRTASPETETTTPPNDWNDIRAPIEAAHNKTRDDREQKYVTDRVALEDTYHANLQTIQQAKQDALVAAGLNPDGSPPSDYGQTAPPVFDVGGS